MKGRKLQKDASHVTPFLFSTTRAAVTADAHSRRGRGRGPGAGGWAARAAADAVGSGGLLADELALNVTGSGTEVLAGGGASGAQTARQGPDWEESEAAQRSHGAGSAGLGRKCGSRVGSRRSGPRASGLLGAAWPQVLLRGAGLCALRPLGPSVLPSRSVLNAQPWFPGSPRARVEASNQSSAPQGRTVIFLFVCSFTFQIHYN